MEIWKKWILQQIYMLNIIKEKTFNNFKQMRIYVSIETYLLSTNPDNSDLDRRSIFTFEKS